MDKARSNLEYMERLLKRTIFLDLDTTKHGRLEILNLIHINCCRPTVI